MKQPASQEGIPDWLQELDENAGPVAQDVTEAALPSLPEGEPTETGDLAMADIEQTLDGEPKPALAELGFSDDPERPAWLQELQAEILDACSCTAGLSTR